MLEKIKKLITEKEYNLKGLKKEGENLALEAEKHQKDSDLRQESLILVQEAMKQTQEQLSENISGIVSLALESVFDDPYKFVVDFIVRRNSTECDLLFERNGSTKTPLKECGYGPADICALATRIGIWGMQKNAANTIVLDEPFRNLQKDKLTLAGDMIKYLSEELGIQFIIVTHETSLANIADKVFTVKKAKGFSVITEE